MIQKLQPRQALISQDNPLGFKDYFLAELTYDSYHRKYKIKTHDVPPTKVQKLIAGARIDHSNRTITAWCCKGYSLRKEWNSIEQHKKINIL